MNLFHSHKKINDVLEVTHATAKISRPVSILQKHSFSSKLVTFGFTASNLRESIYTIPFGIVQMNASSILKQASAPQLTRLNI